MQVLELANGLHHKGWAVQVISLIKPSLNLMALEETGIQFNTLNMSKGVPDPRAIWKLRGLIKQFKPDIVHSHMVHANLLARITRLFAPVPVLVSTAHSTNEGGKLRMLMYRVTDSLCELTTNVSQEAVDSYIEKKVSPRHKIKFIPNGVNLKKFQRNSEDKQLIRQELGLGDEFIWLAVGRLSEVKDYPTLIKAWSRMVQENNNCVLLIVGDGDDREALKQLTESLNLTKSIKFLGIRDDIPRLMNAANAYVMSSLWEGMPMVLLESSACELPNVATDVGGNREVVRDGISGYLAKAADPEHLVSKMLALMALPEAERVAMGRRGREYVMEHYELDAIITRWEGLYCQLNQTKMPLGKPQGGVL